MKILISGASGLVGTELSRVLRGAGHTIVPLTRKNPPPPGEISWNPQGKLQGEQLEGIDAVIHLAGENIAGRWTAAKKKSIRDSRVVGTQTLAEAVRQMRTPARAFVCASAIGFYGNRGDELLTESSPPGKGFLPEVCQEWENAADSVASATTRVVKLRIGVVLSPKGGALAKMLLPFKMGVGGVVGSGKQWMSCISLDDVVGAIVFALNTESLSGPVNLVLPEPSTNREFTKTLGKVLSRPTIFPMPVFVVRIVFGEMGEELLLGSTRVKPEKLMSTGFQYKHPNLEVALRGVLGR